MAVAFFRLGTQTGWIQRLPGFFLLQLIDPGEFGCAYSENNGNDLPDDD